MYETDPLITPDPSDAVVGAEEMDPNADPIDQDDRIVGVNLSQEE